MKAISHQLTLRIKHLRRKGCSYKEIAKKLPVSVGTSYNYAKDVMVTPAGLKRLKRKQGNGRPPKEISIEKDLTVEKVQIISHCLFDGSVIASNGDYMIKYTNASHGLIKQFIDDMRKVYDIESDNIRSYNGKTHPWREITYRSKNVVEDLMRYSSSYSTSEEVGLPKGVDENKKFVQTFLRAFWDDEGSIAQDGALVASSKSQRLIDEIKLLHDDLGVNCTIHRKTPCLTIYVKKNSDNFHRFRKRIGFTESVVTRGKHVGLKKSKVLADFLNTYEY